MEILLKFTKASFFLGGKVLVTSEDESSELSMKPKEAASMNGSGACNDAKQATSAVAAAAAAATVEHATIIIPALQHRRNLSAFNWNGGQGYDKTLSKLPAALPANDSQKNNSAKWETSAGLGEKVDMQGGYQLRRSGKALDDLKGMLEVHEIQFPNCSYEEFEEFEEYESNKLETIWEEEEDEQASAFL